MEFFIEILLLTIKYGFVGAIKNLIFKRLGSVGILLF